MREIRGIPERTKDFSGISDRQSASHTQRRRYLQPKAVCSLLMTLHPGAVIAAIITQIDFTQGGTEDEEANGSVDGCLPQYARRWLRRKKWFQNQNCCT